MRKQAEPTNGAGEKKKRGRFVDLHRMIWPFLRRHRRRFAAAASHLGANFFWYLDAMIFFLATSSSPRPVRCWGYVIVDGSDRGEMRRQDAKSERADASGRVGSAH